MRAMSEGAGSLDAGAGTVSWERAVLMAEDDSMAESLFQMTWTVGIRVWAGAKFGSIP